MIKKWIYKLITLFFLAISFPTYAQLVTIEYTATVDRVDDMYNVLNGEVTIGQTVTGSYTFDASLPDSDPNPEFGRYEHPDMNMANLGIKAQIGNMRFVAWNGPSNPDYSSPSYTMYVENSSYVDIFDASMSSPDSAIGSGRAIGELYNQITNISSAYIEGISAGFTSPSVNVLNSDTIDEALSKLNHFTDNMFFISGRGYSSSGSFTINARITSFTSSADPISCTPTPSNDSTLAFKARVNSIYQSNPANTSSFAQGDIISGSYQFDPNTPDTNPSAEFAQYSHNTDNVLKGININIAGSTFSDNNSTMQLDIRIDNHPANIGPDMYEIMALNSDIKLSSGSTIHDVNMHFYDPTGTVLSANTLAGGTPASVNGWLYKDLFLYGTNPDGSYFYINAEVEEAGSTSAAIPASPVHVSPASGPLVMGQSFDAGIVIDSGQNSVEFIDATLSNTNGVTYINCMINPPVTDGRQTVLCPNFSTKLVPGSNVFTVKINLVTGQVLNSTVNWDVVGY